VVEATRHHRRTALRVIIVAELVLALVTGATVALAYNHVNNQIGTGPGIVHEVDPPPATSAFNILVMGLDTRDCDGCDVDSETGAGGSDTTMLIHVADGRRSAYGISIPRDTLVDRPECTRDGKTIPAATDVIWNKAYELGGPACTLAQLEAVTGIYVNDYIAVDFGGFKEMVDSVGGVEVCIPKPIDDDKADIHFEAGTQTLDGKKALEYVRERHSTANSDLGRMRRQQAFVSSMLTTVKSKGTLARPDRLFSFANALAGSIETNPEISSAGKLVDLARSLQDTDLAHIRFVTAPTTDFPEDSPNWGRLQLTDEAPALWQKVIRDKPLGTLGKGAISARSPSGSKTEAAANGLC
jgi:LCP family protein required for cell wall assembly